MECSGHFCILCISNSDAGQMALIHHGPASPKKNLHFHDSQIWYFNTQMFFLQDPQFGQANSWYGWSHNYTQIISIRMFWGLNVGGLWIRRWWLLFWPYLFKRTNGMTNSFQIIPQLFEQYVKLKWVRLNLRGRNFEKMQYRNSQSAISTPPFLIFILWF